MMQWLDAQWATTTTVATRRDMAAAAVAHLVLWLGWLQSNKTFSLSWADISIT